MNARVEVYENGRLLTTLPRASVSRARSLAEDLRWNGFHVLVIYGRGTHDV